jgi:predicted DNA-binding antitoxin AbrB/MazE fold protein
MSKAAFLPLPPDCAGPVEESPSRAMMAGVGFPAMTQITEATFDGGVLRPTGKLSLREHERVRIIVQSLEGANGEARTRAIERLRVGIASMGFRSTGRYAGRDELPERL